jgi:hypothetical protein
MSGDHNESRESQLLTWLRELGLRFDPFSSLDAAADPRLSEYLVGHQVFSQVWGDWISWLFAPPGGGKTALRVRTTQACWIGQETNRPFPIPYTPPFLSWGHASPSLDDHLTALARSGATALLLSLAYRPHWFFRLDEKARRNVRDVLDWNLPGSLSVYLDHCRQSRSLQLLRESLGTNLMLPDPPDAATLLRWCETLDEASDGASGPPAKARWDAVCRLLLRTLDFRSVYILIDGLDAAPETVSNAEAAAGCLAPVMPLVSDWADQRIFVKGFLPLEMQDVLPERFTSAFVRAKVAKMRWEPPLLAEVVRRRVYVASEGAFGSLDAIASPGLQDVETILAESSLPLPREMLVLTRRMLQEHIWRDENGERIQEKDLKLAIEWYDNHRPAMVVDN